MSRAGPRDVVRTVEPGLARSWEKPESERSRSSSPPRSHHTGGAERGRSPRKVAEVQAAGHLAALGSNSRIDFLFEIIYPSDKIN